MIDNPDDLDATLRPIVKDELAKRQDAAPTVGTAETVNVGGQLGKMPHSRWSMILSCAIFTGFSTVSLIVLLNDYDGLTKGLIIGTWTSTAVGMFQFWLGSSSAGKSQGVSNP